MTTNALKAAELLEKQGIDASVVHFHTVKPLDEAAVREHAENARLVVTAEEGVAIGGFGSAVTDFLVKTRGQSLPAMMRLALPDEFPKKYGSQNDHFEIYGLMPNQIAASVSKALGKLELVA
jgi:transketolase